MDVVLRPGEHGGLCTGMEYGRHSPEADGVVGYLDALQPRAIRAGSGISIKPVGKKS